MSSLAAKTRECLRHLSVMPLLLDQCQQVHRNSMPKEAIEYEHGRFRIWTGNLGALQKGNASLDFRLRESVVMRANIVKLLDQLQSAVTQSSEILTGKRVPWEQLQVNGDDEASSDDDSESNVSMTSSTPGTELAVHLSTIKAVNSDLYKLSFKIRSPNTHDISLRGLNYQETDPDTGVGLFSAYADFDRRYVEEHLVALRRANLGWDKDPLAESAFLIDRITKGITNRRRYIRYWKKHAAKLAIEEPVQQGSVVRPTREANAASGGWEALNLHIVPNSGLSIAGKTLLSGTEATTFDANLEDEPDTQSNISYTTTVYGADGAGLELPPPPHISAEQTEFICPYCSIACPADHAKRKAWKTHILRDLQPYICTYPECSTPEQMFSSRRVWLEHERLNHRRKWQCFEHAGTLFPSVEYLQNHLIDVHKDLTPVQIGTITKHSEVSTADERKTCPFCLADGPFRNGLHYHMAFHMEALSLFSIPKGANTSDDISGDGSDKSLVQSRMSQHSLGSGSLNFNSPVSSRISESVSDVVEVLSLPSDQSERPSDAIPETQSLQDLFGLGPVPNLLSGLFYAAEGGLPDQVERLLELTTKEIDITSHGEDYFDSACAKLVVNMQEWAWWFSRASYDNSCRLLQNLEDESIADRFKNTLLDGEDIDKWLQDRSARRKVFESVTATMIWEFIFTRFLFGLARQHRARLVAAEKNLAANGGPRELVLRWTAVVRFLLSENPDSVQQREAEMEALAVRILETLSDVLPPPEEARSGLLEQLHAVLRIAINISIDMVTQEQEHIVLPPLQPEFDEKGNLARHVFFNAALMDERERPNGISNEDLEKRKAIVSIVLFPLVVKKFANEDEVVIYPAQVLVQEEFKKIE